MHLEGVLEETVPTLVIPVELAEVKLNGELKNKHFKMSNSNIKCSKFHFLKIPNCHGSAYIWEHEKRKVATKTSSYERYKEFLFQKVASGYLLHFVHDGSSKRVLEKYVLHNNVKHT